VESLLVFLFDFYHCCNFSFGRGHSRGRGRGRKSDIEEGYEMIGGKKIFNPYA
jgi:hypothetical protein